ncbi:MAG: four helix bundle protein [Bdellovibrio sp.]|nr:four helix bundle protein [Bdellovibrio sp.]
MPRIFLNRLIQICSKSERRLSSLFMDRPLRASSSIVLNISEGSGRMSNKDQRRFYSIAFGSTREVQSILDIIDEQYVDLIKTADSVAACLYRLLNPKK